MLRIRLARRPTGAPPSVTTRMPAAACRASARRPRTSNSDLVADVEDEQTCRPGDRRPELAAAASGETASTQSAAR